MQFPITRLAVNLGSNYNLFIRDGVKCGIRNKEILSFLEWVESGSKNCWWILISGRNALHTVSVG